MVSAKQLAKRAFLKLFSLSAGIAGARGVPVILYHSVSREPSVVSMPADLFHEEMKLFQGKGYRAVPLQVLPGGEAGKRKLKEKELFLTFDDGLESLYEDVFPALQSLGFSATVFLVTGKIGGRADWYPEESGGVVPALPLLNWSQIREMHKYGIDFQAHTHTHPHLTELPLEKVAEETRRSREIIEDKLGSPVNLFCYPNGKYSPDIVSVVRDCGFHASATLDLGVYRPGDDPFRIKRLGHDMTRVRNAADVRMVADLLLSGGFAPYLRFKKRMRSLGLVSAPFELKNQAE